MTMKPETYVCIQGGPNTPKDSTATLVDDVYLVKLANGTPLMERTGERPRTFGAICLSKWQVEQNPECWIKAEEYTRGWRFDSEGHAISIAKDYNCTCDEEVAEQKRQESMAKRFVPRDGEKYYFGSSSGDYAVETHQDFSSPHDYALCYIGGMFPYTPEGAADCVRWQKEYAQYFQIPNQE